MTTVQAAPRMRLALELLLAIAFAAMCAVAAYGYLAHHAALAR